jgi:hypothetical protein
MHLIHMVAKAVFHFKIFGDTRLEAIFLQENRNTIEEEFC